MSGFLSKLVLYGVLATGEGCAADKLCCFYTLLGLRKGWVLLAQSLAAVLFVLLLLKSLELYIVLAFPTPNMGRHKTHGSFSLLRGLLIPWGIVWSWYRPYTFNGKSLKLMLVKLLEDNNNYMVLPWKKFLPTFYRFLGHILSRFYSWLGFPGGPGNPIGHWRLNPNQLYAKKRPYSGSEW